MELLIQDSFVIGRDGRDAHLHRLEKLLLDRDCYCRAGESSSRARLVHAARRLEEPSGKTPHTRYLLT